MIELKIQWAFVLFKSMRAMPSLSNEAENALT